MEGETVMDMLTLVGNGIGTVLGWTGDVLDALLTSDGALATVAPLFAVGISISAIMLGVKIVRGFIWGA